MRPSEIDWKLYSVAFTGSEGNTYIRIYIYIYVYIYMYIYTHVCIHT